MLVTSPKNDRWRREISLLNSRLEYNSGPVRNDYFASYFLRITGVSPDGDKHETSSFVNSPAQNFIR